MGSNNVTHFKQIFKDHRAYKEIKAALMKHFYVGMHKEKLKC